MKSSIHYAVVCAKSTRKIWCEIFLHYTDVVIFMLGYFILTHPVCVYYT